MTETKAPTGGSNMERAKAGTNGIAAAVVIAWGLESFAEVEMPGPVAAALGALIGSIAGLLWSEYKDWKNAKLSRLQTPWWVVALLLLVMLSGCASLGGGPRTAYASAAETTRILYLASAQKYAACHTAAGANEAELARCWVEKNARGETIGQALPFLQATKTAIITADAVATDDNLQRAQRILASMTATLLAFMTNEDAQAVGWIEL